MSKIYKAIMIERKVGSLFRKQAKSAGITQSEYLERLMTGKKSYKVNK